MKLEGCFLVIPGGCQVDSRASKDRVELTDKVGYCAARFGPDAFVQRQNTGQDYRGAQYILDISRNLHKAGKTVIVITRHLYLMPEYADRVVVMGKGTLLLDQDIRTAFHASDVLQSTFLTAPQAVHLSQELQQLNGGFPPLLTSAEITHYFAPEGSAA
jgi:energy-coupling factor transport system ATP-binding protein